MQTYIITKSEYNRALEGEYMPFMIYLGFVNNIYKAVDISNKLPVVSEVKVLKDTIFIVCDSICGKEIFDK